MLCFVGAEGDDDRGAWEGGEVGGYEAYLLADDDGEAAEVYKAVSWQGSRAALGCGRARGRVAASGSRLLFSHLAPCASEPQTGTGSVGSCGLAIACSWLPLLCVA